MSTPLRRSFVAVVAALSTALVGMTAAQPASAATGDITFTKLKLSPATDLDNPMRGQYRWLNQAPTPTTWPATDVYYRDQTYWGRLEPTKGVYDFKWIEDGLKKAGATKGKFGFRVMAWCPECWMTTRTDKVAFPSVLPSYVPLVKGVPNWNSEAFLSGYERLMAALGAKYANDPRLGYVDVGGYGKFGEWWVGKDDLHITEANGLRLVRAVNKAFPNKIILFNTMQSVDFTLKALATNPRMGMRTDSLGEKNMYSMAAVDTRLQSFWKTRPFFTEWATSGDPVAAAAQVKQFHLSTISSGNLRLAYSSMTSTQQAAYRATIRSSGYRYYLSKVTMKPLVRGTTVPVTVTMSNVGVAPDLRGLERAPAAHRRQRQADLDQVPVGRPQEGPAGHPEHHLQGHRPVDPAAWHLHRLARGRRQGGLLATRCTWPTTAVTPRAGTRSGRSPSGRPREPRPRGRGAAVDRRTERPVGRSVRPPGGKPWMPCCRPTPRRGWL